MANEFTEESVIIYDIASLPDYDEESIVSLKEIFEFFRKEKLVLWDSSKNGSEPQVIPPGDYKIKDVNNDIDRSL